jgi:hypothetical protein
LGETIDSTDELKCFILIRSVWMLSVSIWNKGISRSWSQQEGGAVALHCTCLATKVLCHSSNNS